MQSAPTPGEATPRARLVVAAGVGLEALLLLAWAVLTAGTSATGAAQDRLGALVLAVTALALAVGLGAVAAGVRNGAGWARTPALLWQLIQVLTAVTTLPWQVSVVLVPLGLAVGYGVLRPEVIPR